jgi:FixJ family two-component response regulator
MNEQNTVYIVDDEAPNLGSICWALESAGYKVETYSSPLKFLEQASSSLRGCLLLDIQMPEMDGLEVQRQLAAREIDLPIIVISAYANVSDAVTAMKAGAVDLIEKPIEEEQLMERVEAALREDEKNADHRARGDQILRRVRTLTGREKEVMDLVVSGSSNKDIAEALGISNKTVEAHRAKVMRKMQADSLAGLVRDVMFISR